MRAFLLLAFSLFSGCVHDIQGLGNHHIDLPEHTLLVLIKRHVYVVDIDKKEVVDSVFLAYEWPEIDDHEYIHNFIITPQNYVAYPVELKYACICVEGNIIRILNPSSGKIVKEIEVYPSPASLRPFYKSGHQYAFVPRSIIGEHVISVVDLTDLKLIKEFNLDGGMGRVSQDIDGSVYYVCLFGDVYLDSAVLRRFDVDDLEGYTKIMSLGKEKLCVVYNKKIYLFHKNRDVEVYDMEGNLIHGFTLPFVPHSVKVINGYFFINDYEGKNALMKLDPETYEYKTIIFEPPYGLYSPNVVYSKKLNLLITSNYYLGAPLHLYFIDFDSFEIVGELLDYKREGAPMGVIE